MTRFVFSIAVFSSLYLNGQVLNYTTSVKIDDNVKTTETSLFIEISNKEENWLSKVSIHHSPNQKFKLLYAQIIDANGKVVRELKKKDVRSRSLYSSEAFFQDDLEKSFDLYWGSYPYRIKYSYSISENEFFSLVRWWPTPFSNVRTDESILRLEVPDDYGFLIDSTQNLLFSKRLTEEKTVYSWSAMNIDRYEEEPFSPSYWELIPHVFAVPKRFQYGVSGSSSSWQEFGNWQAKLNEGTTQLPIKEQQIIDNLVRNASSKIEIIKKIYHYLQDKTTYVNVSIEKGGLKSYPASYVSRNKFGDCKALTTYMKAMLKHIGIDSYYTLIRAGENEHNIVKTLPGQQFNHVILTIPLNQDTIWLETTSQTSPFDYLGTFTQNRNALFIKEESELVKTPKLSEDDVLIEDKYFLELNESGEGNFTLNRTSRGKEFEIISAHISSLTEDEKESLLHRVLPFQEYKLSNWILKPPKRDSTYVSMSLEGTLFEPIRKIRNKGIVNPIRINIPMFEDPSKRINPVRINYPINNQSSVSYNLKFTSEKHIQLPDKFTISNEFGSYSASYSFFNEEILVEEKFLLKTGFVKRGEYQSLYSFIDKIRHHQKTSPIIITYEE